jgi:hypothetical protein
VVDTEERRKALRESAERFIESAAALPEGIFLREIDGRSPRDIVAHLIGWNRYTVVDYERQQQGERPSYITDPSDDFSAVNAQSVRHYSSRDKATLLVELRASLGELDRLLRSLTLAEWAADYGATYLDSAVTMRWMIAALIWDYRHHQEEIANWRGRTARA